MAVEVEDQQAAVETIVRAVLRAIAQAADRDQLGPECQRGIEAVTLALVADAAAQIPTRARIPVIADAHELIDQFLSACIAETV